MKICVPIQILDEKLSMWIRIELKKNPKKLFKKIKNYIWQVQICAKLNPLVLEKRKKERKEVSIGPPFCFISSLAQST
jgi:hypothetical protein